jgi:hypothetical protein
MEIAHAAGDHALAGTFADRVEDLVRQESRYGVGQRAFLVAVLAFEARTGDLDRLDAVLRSLARAAAAEAAEAAAVGSQEADACPDPDAGTNSGSDAGPDVLHLKILARPRPPFDPRIVTELLEAVADTADREVALALADRGEELLRSDAGSGVLGLREAVTLLLTRHGRVERAMALADAVVEPDLRAARKAEIVEALARSGDTDRAEALGRAFPSLWARSRALMAVVGEMARRGETARAQALIPAIPDRWGGARRSSTSSARWPGRVSRSGPRTSPTRSSSAGRGPARWPDWCTGPTPGAPAGWPPGPCSSAAGRWSSTSWRRSPPAGHWPSPTS